MPTKIEQSYIDQGYTLPAGWDWERVHEARAFRGWTEIDVPLHLGIAVTGWGVPSWHGIEMTVAS